MPPDPSAPPTWRPAGSDLATSASQPDERSSAVSVAPPLHSGAFARGLVQQQIRRLVRLQPQVLADQDPEALHQLRVSVRRLRTVLLQFGPAFELPDRVSERRIAGLARRSGRCRDLDVLRLRLAQQLLPLLPGREQHSLEAVLQRLEHDRAQAFTAVAESLRSRRTLKLLARLQRWQKRPRFTPLGEQPLLPWLSDWQAPFTAGLFLHAGWWEEDPEAESLHALRKRIKAARYALDNLAPWCGVGLQAWLQDLRQAQGQLGDLHDLQVLNRIVLQGRHLRSNALLPQLRSELMQQQQGHWLRWREHASRLQRADLRLAIQRQLLELGRSPATDSAPSC